MPTNGTARRAKSITLNAEGPSRAHSSPSARILVPYHQDPLKALANLILNRHRDNLPDLSSCVVLLSSPLDAPTLRRHLLDAAHALGHEALLGPAILSLQQWLNDVAPPPVAPLSPLAQELILVETLNRHRRLYRNSDPWLLAANLLELFEQLTLRRITLPAQLNEFIAQLSKAYQLGEHNPEALSMEANLVHTLWHAWHRQLQAEDRLDPQTAYITQLECSLAALAPQLNIYLIDGPEPSPAEQHWIDLLTGRGQLTRIEVGDNGPSPLTDPYSHFLDEVFASLRGEAIHVPFQERARYFASHYVKSPAEGHLSVYSASSAEAEARAIDIQVRRWLLAGKQSIAIVSDDRRLARRIRALLERADVNLHDAAGWALSTTAAAAALERWLECLEEDFAYQPLTDLLKSPFLFPHLDHDQRLQAVYRFEQDLVLHENIPRNLQRYRTHLAYRRSRWPQAAGETVQNLLEAVETAAKPLRQLGTGSKPRSPYTWLDALEDSLQRLGMLESFAADAAGTRILQELRGMRQALNGRQLKLKWAEFRTWLGRTLERYNFQPPANIAVVQLMSLEQSALGHYDAILIAGATAQHLPGTGQVSPFFNEGVRRELGLPGLVERIAARFRCFRRLLQAAPHVFITARHEENGEPVLASPWLEALQSFHRFAYDRSLHDDDLGILVDDPRAHVTRCDSAALPAPKFMPAPTISRTLLPDKISAHAYQQLVDCPYQFFAARCLQLSAPEQVREALEKSDYGQRIHLALQAFHDDVKGYPGPFDQVVTSANREKAIHCLQDISRAVFAKDLEDNFMHRGWLQRWWQLIPQYIDWQIKRGEHWRVATTETAVEKSYRGMLLNGRIDRFDEGADGAGIVDYKTGKTPRPESVIRGEEVQLPFYALLADRAIHQAEYLSLDGNRFGTQALLQGEELRELTEQNGERLSTILNELADGAASPAWGDEQTCSHCAMTGVCRLSTWTLPTTAKNT